MKKVFACIAACIAVAAILIGLAFATGWLNVGYTETVGKAQKNAETKVFHQTQAYVDGAVADLAKIKLEYDQSSDDTAKHGLVSYVRSRYPDFDADYISDPALKSWYQGIKDGSIN